jgi:hypothetical protein
VDQFDSIGQIPADQIGLDIEVDHDQYCQKEIGTLSPLEESDEVVLVSIYIFGAVVINKGSLLGTPVWFVEECEVKEEYY